MIASHAIGFRVAIAAARSGGEDNLFEQPTARGDDVVQEVLNRSAAGGPLYLHFCQGLCDNDRYPSRIIRRAVQHMLKCRDSFLCLYLHTSHIYQGQMLVRSALKLAVCLVPRCGEVGNVFGREKARHGNGDEARINVDFERMGRLHRTTIATPHYRKIDRTTAGHTTDVPLLFYIVQAVTNDAVELASADQDYTGEHPVTRLQMMHHQSLRPNT